MTASVDLGPVRTDQATADALAATVSRGADPATAPARATTLELLAKELF